MSKRSIRKRRHRADFKAYVDMGHSQAEAAQIVTEEINAKKHPGHKLQWEPQ